MLYRIYIIKVAYHDVVKVDRELGRTETIYRIPTETSQA